MRAEKHYPPADAGEGIISPCNGRLFAATLSQQNLQLCTNYVSSCYFAKYVASVDEHNRVYVGAGTIANGLELSSEFLHNTKTNTDANSPFFYLITGKAYRMMNEVIPLLVP